MTSASQTLSEAIDIPGYGEAISDPARLPPYIEELGGGMTHRVYVDGAEYWSLYGKLHRDGDLPALVSPEGTQAWYQHGQLHRDGDKPEIVRADGTRLWFENGKISRAEFGRG